MNQSRQLPVSSKLAPVSSPEQFFTGQFRHLNRGRASPGFMRDMNKIWSVPRMKIKAYAVIMLFMTSGVTEAQEPAKWEWTVAPYMWASSVGLDLTVADETEIGGLVLPGCSR